MSAFTVIYDQSNTDVNKGKLERAMGRLSHRGPDGFDIYTETNIAMGHWHFWTTPEEMGEKQPLEIKGLPFRIVLDGRLDNRSELISKLGILASDASHLSDAVLILKAYDRWDVHCFEHFIGPFALVLFNRLNQELICARDAMGDRTLFFKLNSRSTTIASEPWAVVGAGDEEPILDESGAAHFFAFDPSPEGRTLFKNVYELLPAEVMVVNRVGEQRFRYWKPNSVSPISHKNDKEFAEHFHFLLEQAVHCRMRSTTPIGVLMSGGLDSTSVACLAARKIAPETLVTISYVFDELKDCDERRYINSMKEAYGIRSIQLPSDDLWPLKDWYNWPSNPNQPEDNLYRLIKERAYLRTQQEGLRVLLTGGFGDHLYSGEEEWLADLLSNGQILESWNEINYYIHCVGIRRTLNAGFLQAAGRRIIQKILGGKNPQGKRRAPKWLTPYAVNLLKYSEIDSIPQKRRRRNLVSYQAAKSCSGEIPNASRYSFELRHPYRDRRLIEFFLGLPAFEFYRHGVYKYILRNSMEGELPEIIRSRPMPTTMTSMFLRGWEYEKEVLQSCFHNPVGTWRRFINEKWISERWLTPSKKDGIQNMIAWACISSQAWYERIFSVSSNININ